MAAGFTSSCEALDESSAMATSPPITTAFLLVDLYLFFMRSVVCVEIGPPLLHTIEPRRIGNQKGKDLCPQDRRTTVTQKKRMRTFLVSLLRLFVRYPVSNLPDPTQFAKYRNTQCRSTAFKIATAWPSRRPHSTISTRWIAYSVRVVRAALHATSWVKC